MIAKHSAATTVATPSDHEIVVTRLVAAPRRLVFEAYTNPAHVVHWMLGPEGWTMPVCEIDLRPGGAWHFVWRRSDGSEMEMRVQADLSAEKEDPPRRMRIITDVKVLLEEKDG